MENSVGELYLSNESYEVHKFYNGKEVLSYLEHDTPDLAILGELGRGEGQGLFVQGAGVIALVDG